MLAIYSCSNACTEYGACVSGSAMEYERGGGDDRGKGGPSGPEPRSEATTFWPTCLHHHLQTEVGWAIPLAQLIEKPHSQGVLLAGSLLDSYQGFEGWKKRW